MKTRDEVVRALELATREKSTEKCVWINTMVLLDIRDLLIKAEERAERAQAEFLTAIVEGTARDVLESIKSEADRS